MVKTTFITDRDALIGRLYHPLIEFCNPKYSTNILITIITGTACLVSCMCNNSQKEYSEILHEKGKVITTLYNKGHSDVNVAPGITTGGDVSVGITSTHIPETWGVVFRCRHGNKFPVQGSGEEYKKLWEKLDDGDSVIISYKEVYRVEYSPKTKEVISKEVIDYDFIGAEKF